MTTTTLRRMLPKALRQRVRSLAAYPSSARLTSDLASFRTLRRLENSTTKWNGLAIVELRLRPLRGAALAVRPETDDHFILRDTFQGLSHLPPPATAGEDLGLIVDLGAHIGSTAAHLAAEYPSARVIAVEADPENAALCRRNLAALGDRATVEDAAIWVQDGPVPYSPPDGNKVAGRVVDGATTAAVASVRGLSMDTLLERHADSAQQVDYVKVDIEGAERELLRTNTGWAARVRSMRVEVHPPYTIDECLVDLSALGFEVVVSYAGGRGMPVIDAVRPAGNGAGTSGGGLGRG